MDIDKDTENYYEDLEQWVAMKILQLRKQKERIDTN